MAPFFLLPAELVEHIASFLPKDDILNFRLTCRQFHQASQTTFATAYFFTVTLDLCPPTLQRLQRIAQADFLPRYVRTVIFTPNPTPRCPIQPPLHLPGTGYHWARLPLPDSTTEDGAHVLQPLNPSAGPINDLRAALSALPNLQTLILSNDLGPEPEPPNSDSGGLFFQDTLHIALLCAAHLPLRTFRIQRGYIERSLTHALLPTSVLSNLTPSTWGVHLVDLALRSYPVANVADLEAQAGIMVVLVQRARALRKLALHDFARGFYREFLTATTEAERLPLLEVLEMRATEGVITADVLGGFVLRFKDTLKHLYLLSARMETTEEWKTVLAQWAGELDRLVSFNIREIKARGTGIGPQAGWAKWRALVFDDITAWEGSEPAVPEEGIVEFAIGNVGPRKQGMIGLMFACAKGRERSGDAQRVLRKLADVARAEIRVQEAWDDNVPGWSVIDTQCVIGGRLWANASRAFNSPDL